MLFRFPAFFMAFGIGIAMAKDPCPEKITDHASGKSCAFMEGKPDSTRWIFVIAMKRPPLDEENSIENMEKLRRWTDSLFNNFDLYYPNATSAATSPPDSLLNWETEYLSLDKATVLAIADLDFVREIHYYDLHIVSIGAAPRGKAVPGSYRNFSADGRWKGSVRTGSRDSEYIPHMLFRYQN